MSDNTPVNSYSSTLSSGGLVIAEEYDSMDTQASFSDNSLSMDDEMMSNVASGEDSPSDNEDGDGARSIRRHKRRRALRSSTPDSVCATPSPPSSPYSGTSSFSMRSSTPVSGGGITAYVRDYFSKNMQLDDSFEYPLDFEPASPEDQSLGIYAGILSSVDDLPAFKERYQLNGKRRDNILLSLTTEPMDLSPPPPGCPFFTETVTGALLNDVSELGVPMFDDVVEAASNEHGQQVTEQ